MATADREPRVATGDPGTQAATGDPGTQAATGDPGTQAATGDPGTQAATGDPGTQAATGDPGTQAATADRVYGPPPKYFLAARRPGNTQSGPAEMKLNWVGPAVTKASWTRPTLGGAPKAPILRGTGEEQALGGARAEPNWPEAARRKVS